MALVHSQQASGPPDLSTLLQNLDISSSLNLGNFLVLLAVATAIFLFLSHCGEVAYAFLRRICYRYYLTLSAKLTFLVVKCS